MRRVSPRNNEFAAKFAIVQPRVDHLDFLPAAGSHNARTVERPRAADPWARGTFFLGSRQAIGGVPSPYLIDRIEAIRLVEFARFAS